MLKGLDIRDILIIDHLELSLRAGLNVLTGETGAGKSICLIVWASYLAGADHLIWCAKGPSKAK